MIRSLFILGLGIGLLNPTLSSGGEGPTEEAARLVRPDDWPDDPAVLLRQLKTRDAEFDNRSIETEQRWIEKVSPRGQVAERRFNAVRFGQPDHGAQPQAEIPDDFDQPHRLRRLLTVRGPEVTIERLEDLATMKHPEYVALPNRGCRWSSAGGVERVWSPETNDLHIEGTPASDGLLRWDAHMLEWACGYGIAKWMESVDSMRVGDGMLTVKGKIRLMGYDDSRVELQLDPDRIVRRAVISVPGKDGGGSNDYVVDTSGTVRPEGCPPVARSGRFRRILKPVGKPETVYQDFEVRFVAISARLTDEQYAERTRIVPTPNAVTIDNRRQ